MNVDDEIVAGDGYRVVAEKFDERLKNYRPGDSAELLIARRGRMMSIAVTFGLEPENVWELEVDPDSPDDRAERRKAWLGL